MTERVDLERIPLFAELSPEDRARAARVARPLAWGVGHLVVRQGEFAFDFYAITRGAAEVRQDDRPLSTLGPGDYFGELGVIPAERVRWSRRRSASVVVTAPTSAIAISGGDIRRLAQDIPALGDALRSAATERARHDAT